MNLQKACSLFGLRMKVIGDNMGRSLVKPGAKELAEKLKKKTPLTSIEYKGKDWK